MSLCQVFYENLTCSACRTSLMYDPANLEWADVQGLEE